MSDTNVTAPEDRLDEIVSKLVAGDATNEWLTEAPALFDAAPEYDLRGSITRYVAEGRLDDLLVRLVSGDTEAREAWLRESDALLKAAPGFNLADNLTGAIEALKGDYGPFTSGTAVSQVTDQGVDEAATVIEGSN
jgi:hypothetical protein